MPRFATYPYLFDEEKSISTDKLSGWGYLKHGFKSGTITWSRNGVETSSISIRVKMFDYETSLTVNYKCNGNSYDDKIQLVSLPSNLGKGRVWYFICPFTKKRCRKLHLINERFMHRSNLPSGMYECQTKSKKWRQIESVYGEYFEGDNYYSELYSKHFKKFYNGKPTKKYIKLMRKIKRYESYSVDEIQNLFLMK